ncbi:MAG TPA: hypothetical protein P5572_14820 [Phycisphaerae bacterium]|nr:DUF883 family protein [Phycisphaerales bacterium]HRX86290.1 hypothetical protein [Phycisphaerae bacterium]
MGSTATRSSKNDVATSAQRFRDDLKSTGQTMKDELGNLAGDAKDIATDAGRAARRSIEPVEGYIRDNPMRTALIAAGIGVLVGALFIRR